GNLYTIIGNEKVAVAANSDLNTVVFIHRNDPNRFGGNSGHFRYDVSTDGGQNWTTNVGRLNPSNNNTTLGGRYPQIVIHNPTANTNPSNAYMGYLGTYHDGNNWMGTVTGVCRLDNDTTTITEKYTPQSNGHTSMGSGLCNGEQDVFWSINFTVNGDFTVGTQYNNLLINKGIYNSGTNDIDWTYDSLLITHDITYDGNTRADAWNMAFDPTGQYGWIVYVGEITNNGEKTYEPIFFNSSDNGNTWNGPITLNPRFFANIMAGLSPSGPDTATCAWETDIVVDINGDPHVGVLVGSAANYSIYNTLNMYLADITYSWTDDKWYSIILDTVETFRNNATVSTYHDSRPQMALSPAGDKVFFTWVDSDSSLTAGANSLPDLFGKGYDINTKLATPTVNFTQGNCAWDSKALFASSANNAFKSGTTYQVHTVITELNSAADELDTTYFHYLDNITFKEADFTETLSTSPYVDEVIAQFSTTDTSICAPDSVTFTDKSQNSPTSWAWSFPGATPSSSTLQNPSVAYTVAGTYDVTLIAIRGADIDTLIKSNYISVRTTNSQPVGTSTNLYSTITNQANVIASNNDLNTIVFVHRNNTNLFGGNSGQYRYDISTDGGVSWATEIGEINSTADGVTINGRYPQAAIHNPTANSIPDSAYLVYTSTYHDGATWLGMNTGVAKLNNNAATFTSQEVIQRNGEIGINTGFCNGAQDEFWGVTFGYNKTTGAVMDLVVSNGTFNTSARDLNWTYDSIAVAHNIVYDGFGKVSAHNIAFDPTGQYGWIAYSGHVKKDTNWVLQPIFYKTVNGGTSWTGPDTLDLSFFPNAYIGMDLQGTGVPTTSFENDLIVDVNGDPHYGVIVGSGSNYSIQSTLDMMVMDIHYNSTDGEWYSIFLDSIKTLRWQVTTGVAQDNRPQMSLSSTGEQVFFTWVDSDPLMTGGDNSLPDLYGRGYDINTRKGTPVINFTKDDCNWENKALLPAVSTNALKQVTTHIIPTVMARLNVAGNELDTTYYDYFENVQFDDADFTETLNISKYSNLPVADFRSFDTTLCKGDTINFLDRSLSKPLSWSWSFPGATPSSSTLRDPQNISYSTAGNFDVSLIITNAIGQDTVTFTNYINVGEVPTINTVTTVDVRCFGSNDGSINIDFSGGTSPFTFTWSNGDSIQNLSGLGQDTLSLSIVDSFGCSTTLSDTIWEPTVLSLQMGSSDINCYGDDDGTATSTVNGGTAGYTYSWFSGESTSSLDSLSSGNYYLTVFDANNCSVFDTVTITAPSPITIQISSIDANCGVADGSISTNVTGGDGGFTYNWSTGATSSSIVSLDAGTYYITVVDVSGCEKTSSANIQNSTAPSLNMSATGVTCFGNDDGKAKVDVSGGVQPYTYLWDDPVAQTTSEATGLTSGTYTVIVKDAQDCQISDNTTVSEPDSLELDVLSLDASCGSSDGSVSVSANGGTPGYTYMWSTGETATQITVQAGSYSVTATDFSGCEIYGNTIVNNIGAPVISFTSTDITCNGNNDGTIDITASGGAQPLTYTWSSGQTIANITGLGTGDYTLTLEDAVNCKAFEVITISEPEPLLIGSVVSDVSCFGKDDGSIVIVASGGDGSYSYNWSTGSTSGNVSGLAPGTYTVTVIDGNSCSGISFISIAEPVELIVTALGTDISCFGELDGSAEASTSGGAGSLTYDWSTSETTQSITDLGKGSYSVMVTDSNGCAKMDLTTIVEPDSLYLQTSSTDESAAGAGDGTATVTPVGGTGPYTYQWSTGGNTSSITGLSAGVYSVIVTDASSCLSTAAVSIGVGGAIDNITNGLNVEVFPNPSDGVVNIKINSSNINDVSIEIYDVIGNRILTFNDAKYKDGIIQFDLNNYSEGVYLIKINTGTGVVLKKVNLIRGK
ncbi:T9SS type A sorting domain-containing protein, partial [Cytophagaceae bacterium AH-315-L13]|nr:T9SS type A sorting domain-containing protein [Cytophagaceae bacterium AH-315-L13]